MLLPGIYRGARWSLHGKRGRVPYGRPAPRRRSMLSPPDLSTAVRVPL